VIPSEYVRLLGYPAGTELEGDVLVRAGEAIGWHRRNGRPRVYLRRHDSGLIGAVTAGRELDEEVAKLWAADRVDEAYFLDRLGAALVEELANGIGARRSPGTGNVPFEEQRALFEALAPLAPEIEMLPSGMLVPKNTLLAVFSSSRSANPCSSCGLSRCAFRRRAA
jgi:hypothetical protein